MAKPTPPTLILLLAAALTGCDSAETSIKEETKKVQAAALSDNEIGALMSQGEAIYINKCLMCHQTDGTGAPTMSPSLAGLPAMLDDDATWHIQTVLLGVGGGAPSLEGSGDYRMPMAGFPELSDEQVAAVLTYVRRSWDNEGRAINPAKVTAVRNRLIREGRLSPKRSGASQPPAPQPVTP